DMRTAAAEFGGELRTIIDTRAISGLLPQSEDEVAARDLLVEQHDLDVVQVGDIANLGRTVLLTLQLSEYGVRYAVALNMADELRSIDDAPDVDALAAITGVPFLTVSALRRWNLAKLRATQTK